MQTTDRKELKPCPFCGGEADFHCWKSGWTVECNNNYCEILPETGVYRSKEEAAEAWNRRAGDTK